MQLLTIKETAERLALSPYTVKEMIRRREIEHVKINSRVSRVSEQVLDEFINKKTIKTNNETKPNKTISSYCLPSLKKLRA